SDLSALDCLSHPGTVSTTVRSPGAGWPNCGGYEYGRSCTKLGTRYAWCWLS
ncbi:hypothetical protein J6590_070272, partial [Homalodisca vitripennis]